MIKGGLTIIFLIFSIQLFAEVSAYYKEVEQRGYEHFGDTVIFPDGSSCSIKDFNEGVCGSKWMTDDYCVEEGEKVWDEDRCCDGLVATQLDSENGQLTCQPEESEWDFNLNHFWIGLALPFMLFAYLTFGIKRRIKERNKKS